MPDPLTSVSKYTDTPRGVITNLTGSSQSNQIDNEDWPSNTVEVCRLFSLASVLSSVPPHTHFHCLLNFPRQTQNVQNKPWLPTSFHLVLVFALFNKSRHNTPGLLTGLWPFYITCLVPHFTFHSVFIQPLLHVIYNMQPSICQAPFWMDRDPWMWHWLYPHWA